MQELNNGKGSPWRIEYDSIVAYCDGLRLKYGISTRTAGAVNPVRGRRRDADLLPFPIEETLSLADVEKRLDYATMTVHHLIQSGSLVAYKVFAGEGGSPWRIHDASLDRYILSLHRMASRPTPAPSAPRR